MISGSSPLGTLEFSRIAAGLAAALLLQSGSAAPAAWGLPQLMTMLAANTQHRVGFVERRYLHFLTRPLESSGWLSFTPPQRVEEATLTPRKETIIADGHTLLIYRAGRATRLDLRDRPEVHTLVEGIQGTLSGNLSMLQQDYSVSLRGDAQHWRLSLVPIQRDAARVVSEIRISGVEGDVSAIDFRFPNGDRSEMTITRMQNPQ